MVANNATSNPIRFSTGQVVATPGALRALEEAGQTPSQFLARHIAGDWGEVDEDDQQANDAACQYEGDVERQDRILSAYRTVRGVRIWIITERDRSVTSLILPEEY